MRWNRNRDNPSVRTDGLEKNEEINNMEAPRDNYVNEGFSENYTISEIDKPSFSKSYENGQWVKTSGSTNDYRIVVPMIILLYST